MTHERKLADLLDRYTRHYKEAVENPRVRWDEGAFRELCRDLHGELGAWIESTKPKPPRVVTARVVRCGWGG